MTEVEVLKDLLTWVRDHDPARFRGYCLAADQKAAARELLRFRILQEPGYLFTLPKSILGKLEYRVTEPAPNPVLLKLCKATRTSVTYALEV